MDIKVSVIIPVYNVAPYLDACLSSCVNQTFRDMEIIVVNDGSTDESSRIIQRYAEKDDRVVVITKENQGLIYARKSGLDIAKGEYIFHLDGDDYVEADAIEMLYDEVIKQEADYVVANYYEVVGNERYEVRRNNRFKGLSGQDLFLCMLRGGFELCMRLIRRSLFDGIAYKPLVIGEDLFTTMQILPKVKKPVVVDACLYNYVRHTGSITKRNDEISWKHKFYMIRSVFSLLDMYPYSQAVKDRVYLMFFSFFLECMSQKKMEVKAIFYDYYWSKKEIKTFLWKKRKDFYLIMKLFFLYPSMAGWIAKLYLWMIVLWRRYNR
ncbi:glycosyltransferase family 2 protein [uncultured Parabacteroides sp.]|jgi:glycosyltransferase involved in cell wall biosynthesis|uniref:glycosyltransferase family 2 protein n=1 Tax=uncultured Parabacteroides sp. TaxID=512312 RepID=UPI0025F4F2E9|nr:glycosyltransferase family 2 protein [uncultured Parabacteroides sp.]